MMTRTLAIALSIASLAPLAAACGAGTPPTMQGRSGMLSKTAIAQKCEEAAKGHDRPFVIEWDATDLASFEALAHRDTVVVKYEGCDIQVLDRCTDPNISAHFGAYGTPQFTSGTVQGFDIGNEGELYAKLPLGAASLSGKVSAGESLHLKYFVSGVATTSRDALYTSELNKIPGCAGATHFVWGYNLGAFELNSAEQNNAEVQAGMGNMGGGASHGHHESALANGGSMDSCSTNDQRACRVPIRLVLRAITQGENPDKNGMQMVNMGGTSLTVAEATKQNAFDNTPMGQAAKLVQEANHRSEIGDGKSCIEMLDHAVNLDPTEATHIGYTHALCQMKSGQCEKGKTELRAELAKRDPNRTRSDADLDKDVAQAANNNCPSSTAKGPAEFISRASHEMTEASTAKDGKRCKAIADAVDSKMKDLDKTPEDRMAHGRGIMTQDAAAHCVAEASSCKDGYEIYKRNYRLQLPMMKPEMVDKTSAEAWGTLIKMGQVKCQ
ncbi:MAG: hypothetical protein ABI461_06910 [Polyangiaceae bacterium]